MMPKALLFLSFLLLSFFAAGQPADSTGQFPVDSDSARIASDSLLQEKLANLPDYNFREFEVTYEEGNMHFTAPSAFGKSDIKINGETYDLIFENGSAKLPFDIGDSKLALFKSGDNLHAKFKLMHFSYRKDGSVRNKKIPFWMSIMPPLIAIFLALIFKEVVASLFTGILAGAFVANGLQFDPASILFSIWHTVDHYIIKSLNDGGHLAIIVFSLLIGGMVGIISRNGGMAGIVQKLSRFAKTPKSAQFVTWLLGIAIFFDDYANTLIVGNTMRSTSDSFRVSREKLAYIVDSTAAPISALAFVTTWIGFELGQIESGLAAIGDLGRPANAYSVFLSSLQYSFYPMLTLIFMLFIIFRQRDYGPMLKAERRARLEGIVAPKQGEITEEGDMEDLTPVEGAPLKWYNAFIPVMAVILVTLFGLVQTGMEACYDTILETQDIGSFSWGNVWSNLTIITGGEQSNLGILIGNADSYRSLLWASFSGVLLAIILTIGGRIMKLQDTMNTMIAGFKAMLPAILILVLAWALAEVTGELFTADYLTSLLMGNISPYTLPPIIFVLAAIISFSTGSSWSTMAILYPIAIPLTWTICHQSGLSEDAVWELMYNVIATVLAASVLGDHCSPISDTTILSSLATDCNHIEHVRTQLPYALTVGLVSLFLCYTDTLFHLPFIVSLPVGIAMLYGVLHFFGKPVPEPAG